MPCIKEKHKVMQPTIKGCIPLIEADNNQIDKVSLITADSSALLQTC